MPVSYESGGRTRQKQRTRAALVEAARELVGSGITPTVEQAAETALISRATAYRYFPNQAALMAATYPAVEMTSLLGDDPPAEVEDRLDLCIRRLVSFTLEIELEARTMLRLSLEERSHDLPLRKGRAIGWIEDALAPLRDRMTAAELHRLALSIRAAVGIEPLTWLTDVAGLSREEAGELMRESAMKLLRATLAEL